MPCLQHLADGSHHTSAIKQNLCYPPFILSTQHLVLLYILQILMLQLHISNVVANTTAIPCTISVGIQVCWLKFPIHFVSASCVFRGCQLSNANTQFKNMDVISCQDYFHNNMQYITAALLWCTALSIQTDLSWVLTCHYVNRYEYRVQRMGEYRGLQLAKLWVHNYTSFPSESPRACFHVSQYLLMHSG